MPGARACARACTRIIFIIYNIYIIIGLAGYNFWAYFITEARRQRDDVKNFLKKRLTAAAAAAYNEGDNQRRRGETRKEIFIMAVYIKPRQVAKKDYTTVKPWQVLHVERDDAFIVAIVPKMFISIASDQGRDLSRVLSRADDCRGDRMYIVCVSVGFEGMRVIDSIFGESANGVHFNRAHVVFKDAAPRGSMFCGICGQRVTDEKTHEHPKNYCRVCGDDIDDPTKTICEKCMRTRTKRVYSYHSSNEHRANVVKMRYDFDEREARPVLGIEWELHCNTARGRENRIADTVEEFCRDPYNPLVIFETDSSLRGSGATEAIFAPMQRRDMVAADWDKCCEHVRHVGQLDDVESAPYSYSGRQAGMHIHVDNVYFEANEDGMILVRLALARMAQDEKISRLFFRASNNFNRAIPEIVTDKNIGGLMRVNRALDDRYSVIANRGETVEIRGFASPFTGAGVRANIAIADAMARLAKRCKTVGDIDRYCNFSTLKRYFDAAAVRDIVAAATDAAAVGRITATTRDEIITDLRAATAAPVNGNAVENVDPVRDGATA